MSLFNTVQADEAASIRSPEWAQPVGNQYNLHQMTPTLYRSALPDERALPLLQKLRIATVINFLPESDAQWLQSSDIKQVQLSYRTNHVDDSEVLAAIRAIQAVAYSFGEWGLQHQRLCVVLNERLDHHNG